MADSKENSEGLGLDRAIEMIRSDLLAARAAGEKADIRRLVESVTVELKVVATSGREGKAGFRVPFVDLELGGSLSRQAEQTSSVTVVFGAARGQGRQPGAGGRRLRPAEGLAELSWPLVKRVLEVIADRGPGTKERYSYGSGCIVAGRTVLTEHRQRRQPAKVGTGGHS